MVDIKLDTSDALKLENEHYVSVRIGEAQKLAKMAASRTYRFPSAAVGNRKYGKVEVFRRVASSVLCIDPSLAAANTPVELNLGDTVLRFDSKVSAAEPQKEATKASLPSQKTSNRVAAAEYLQKHALEQKLSEAMAAVLRERPLDPAAFMAERLTGKPSAAAEKPPLKELNDLQEAAPPSRASNPGPGFGGYYQQHFLQGGSGSNQYAGFSARAPPAQPEPASREETSGCASDKVGADGGSEAKGAEAPDQKRFGEYYTKHFAPMPAAANMSLFKRFENSAPRAQAAAGPASAAAATVPPVSTAAASLARRSHQLPSCGSYHGPTSFGGVVAPKPRACESSVAPAVPSAQSTFFGLKPSVGTWLAARPKPAENCRPAPPARPWALKPSVGTWLARSPAATEALPAKTPKPPSAAPPTASWTQKPSVGTWLAPRTTKEGPTTTPPAQPQAVAKPAATSAAKPAAKAAAATTPLAAPLVTASAGPQVPQVCGLNAARFGPVFWGTGIQPVMAFL